MEMLQKCNCFNKSTPRKMNKQKEIEGGIYRLKET